MGDEILSGGRAFFAARRPCLQIVSQPPSPPTPFPAGRGRSRLFYARGFAPGIPRAEPGRHWSSLPYRYPCGGLVRLVACSTCHYGTKRKCLPSLSPAYTAFSIFSAPIPPTPFPTGRGGDHKLVLPGATAPGTPALGRLRRWLSLPYTCPCGGVLSLSPAYTAFSFFSAPLPRRGRISPRPPSPGGEGGDQGYFYARGFAPCIPGIKPLAALTVPAKPALRREAYPGDSTDSVRTSGRVFPRK